MVDTVYIGGQSYRNHISTFFLFGSLLNGFIFSLLFQFLLCQIPLSLKLFSITISNFWASAHLAHACTCLLVTALVSLIIISLSFGH